MHPASTSGRAIPRATLSHPVRLGAIQRRGVALSVVASGVLASTAFADVLPFGGAPIEANANVGHAVALVDDVDGDGFADLLVGAPYENVSGALDAGRARLHSGLTGALIRTHTASVAEASALYGFAVVGVGDVDGDGRGDYAIGAPWQGASDEGRVSVYSGAAGTLLWSIPGNGATPGWGGVLARVPDASGDLRDELAVGYVGAAATTESITIRQAHNGAVWKTCLKPFGGGAFHRFGHSVTGVPDLDGDGRGDVVVGASRWDFPFTDSGMAFVYSGATAASLGTLASPEAQAFGVFASAVTGVPDVDGDGFGDIAVGAPGEIPPDSALRCGQVHLYSGASRAFLRTLSSDTPIEQGAFGSALAGMDDVDGDGRGDLLVGAPLEPALSGLGRVRRFSGANGTSIGPDFTNVEGGTGFGFSLSAAADVTLDGRPDFAIGAPYVPVGVANAGKAYLYRMVYNDWCSSLHEIPVVTEGSHDLTNVGAGTQAPAEVACSAHGEAEFAADVFLKYLPSFAGTATITTCGQTGFDTRLAVYSAPLDHGVVCTLDELLACNDDHSECPGGTSALDVEVDAGAAYWIRVGGSAGTQGVTAVTILLEPNCPADLDHDGTVDGADLGILLAQFGGGGSGDLNGDDLVDGADLGVLLSSWGVCR